MTLSRVETMHSILGPRKEINITYKDPVETYQTGRGALGTTEPATPTFSYTLSATTHLASVDKPIIYSNLAMLHVGGQNLTALSQYISYRVYKNSTVIITGTQTVTASLYWTLRLTDADLVGVLAGDVIDVMLWSTNADALEWQYDAIGCMITQIKPFNDSRKILFNVTYNGVSYPVFTSGLSPSPASTQYGSYYGCFNKTSGLSQLSSKQVVYAQSEDSNYGIYRLGFGDGSTPTKISNSATKMPRYAQNLGVPTKIIYNELLL